MAASFGSTSCPPKTGWDAERVLRTLEADLKGMEEEHGLRPDMLFFTGDLAFGEVGTKPGETLTDQYDAAHMFLDRIRRSFHVEIPEENTFLVPGNHDIDRGCATRDQTEWLDRQNNLDMVTKLIQDKDIQWKRYMERLQAYKKFLEKGGFEHLLEDPERLVYGIQRLVNGARIGIARLNSAWSCCRDAEKGKLWLAGAWQIGELHQQLTGTLFNIALIHHPLNWLVEHEDPRLEHNFRHEFRFLLHGHEHQGWVHTTTDGFTRIAAAACYERSDHENGYNFVRLDMDAGNGEIWLRKYDPEGGGWIPRIIKNKTNNDGKWLLDHLKWLASSTRI